MSDSGQSRRAAARPTPGQIAWVDLTVPDVERIRDLYAQVVGWQSEDVDMGGYCDFVMRDSRSGRCRRRAVLLAGLNRRSARGPEGPRYCSRLSTSFSNWRSRSSLFRRTFATTRPCRSITYSVGTPVMA